MKENPLKTQVGGGHYKDLVIQPVEYCQKNNLGYCESNVVKYVTRHRSKNGRQDIEKAIHFLQLLLEIEYKEQDLTTPAEMNVNAERCTWTPVYGQPKYNTQCGKIWTGAIGSICAFCNKEVIPLT